MTRSSAGDEKPKVSPRSSGNRAPVSLADRWPSIGTPKPALTSGNAVADLTVVDHA